MSKPECSKELINGSIHGLCCLTGERCTDLEDFARGHEHAKQAIASLPEEDIGYYALARNLFARNRNDEALGPAREAIHYDPEDAMNHALEANILIALRRYEEAVASADRGMQIDAEHSPSINAGIGILNGLFVETGM